MSLSDIVNVVISRQTASVSRTGFGVPLLMSCEAKGLAAFAAIYAKIYTGTDDMVTDGFATTGVAYKMAQRLFGQEYKCRTIVIGKRSSLPTQVHEYTPVVAHSTEYVVDINGTPFSFTSDGTATAKEIVEGLAAAVNAAAWQSGTVYAAGTHVTNDTTRIYVCTDGGTSAGSGGPTGTGSGITDNTVEWDYVGEAVAVTATEDDIALTLTADVAGALFEVEVDRARLTREDVTADAGIVADVVAILNNTALDWYAVLIDTMGRAEITALAADIEARLRIFIATSGDDAILTSSTADIASTLQASSYDRTLLIYSPDPQDRLDAALAGARLPTDPGSETWKFATLVGPAVYTLTPSERAYAVAKGCNVYESVASQNMVAEGTMVGGEFADTVRFLDWVISRMKEDVFANLKKVLKVPFTDGGVSIIEAAVRGVIKNGIKVGGFAEDPVPVVEVPAVADVDSTSRANRILPDIRWSATLAGAIHAVDPINGTVSV